MKKLIPIGFALLALPLALAANGAQKGKGGPVAYRAIQDDKTVTLFAEGTNNSGGWKNELVQLPQEIFPPMFKFVQTPPSGPAIQVITQFSVKASFKAGAPVESVSVTDRAGTHVVTVKKAS